MTPQHKNRIIIVGRLDTTWRNGKQRAYIDGRNQMGGFEKEFSVQLVTAFGMSFSLPLHATGRTAGLDLIDEAQIGKPLVIEGELQRVLRFDRRYAHDTSDLGLAVRETQMRVNLIRLPREDEPLDTTAVWLEGVVANHPNVVRSQANQTTQLSTLLLQVSMERPSAYPGSRAIVQETTDVNLSVGAFLPQAEALYRVGNRVRIEGQLDCALVPLQGEQVDRKLAELDAAWQTTRESLQHESAERQAAAYREYRRSRERLRLAPRIWVLASYIELIEGQPRRLSEARTDRRDRKQRQTSSGAVSSELEAFDDLDEPILNGQLTEL